MLLGRRHPLFARTSFCVQLACAFATGWLIPVDWLPIYTIIWIAMVPAFVPRRRDAFALLGAIVLAWYLLQRLHWQDAGALYQALLYGTFHLFAVVSSLDARAARLARDEVAALNRELTATRHLLEETARAAERTRIAREIHDLLGQHLTALILGLQVAAHKADGEARAQNDQCLALSRLLLSDVREAVSELRDDAGIDLGAALQSIATNAPGLQVTLALPENFHVDDVNTARTVLRCVQEALTNTLRHAGAGHFHGEITTSDAGIELHLYDDGHLQGELRPGNGLKGMRERVEEIGGELELGRRGNALAITARLPPARERMP
jgi:two-component system sensor histidine kinase DesK